VIQHHRDGSVWLIDLESTHGTHINKRKILPNAFEQVFFYIKAVKLYCVDYILSFSGAFSFILSLANFHYPP
jgi:hypothetical protein